MSDIYLEVQSVADGRLPSYLIAAQRVKEITPWPRLSVSSFPGQADWMEGAAVFRGHVLPVLSLNRLLSIDDKPSPTDIALVLEGTRGTFVARIRGVLGMHKLEDLDVRRLPEGVAARRSPIKSVARPQNGSALKLILELPILEALAFGEEIRR